MTKVSNVRFLLDHPALRRKVTSAVVSCLIDGVEVRGIEVRLKFDNTITLVWPSQAKAPSDRTRHAVEAAVSQRLSAFFGGGDS